MQLGKRLYPYPLLSSSKSITGYKNSQYLFLCDEVHTEKDKVIIVNARYQLTNEHLSQMISEGKLSPVCIVECSSSVYRKKIMLSSEGKDIELPLKDFLDRVVISSIVYANENISYFHDDDFIDEYLPYTFEIEKNDILASDDGISFNVNSDEKSDDKVSSIFVIVKSEENDEVMTVELSKRKIEIHLPDNQYNTYYSMKSLPDFQNLFFAMIAIPSLAEALSKLKEDDIENARYKYDWFKSIEQSYKNIKEEDLEQEQLTAIEPLKFAQEVLNFGTISALADINELFNRKKPDINVGDVDND